MRVTDDTRVRQHSLIEGGQLRQTDVRISLFLSFVSTTHRPTRGLAPTFVHNWLRKLDSGKTEHLVSLLLDFDLSLPDLR